MYMYMYIWGGGWLELYYVYYNACGYWTATAMGESAIDVTQYKVLVQFLYRWALWYYKSDKNKDWKDNLKLVISFDTVSGTHQLWPFPSQ